MKNKLILPILLTSVLLTGCGGPDALKSASSDFLTTTTDMAFSGISSPEYSYDYNYGTESIYNEEMITSKIIVTGSLRLETKSLDPVLENLNNKIAESGGYVQSSNISKNYSGNRYYTATVRIPCEKYNAFLDDVKSSANVLSYGYSTEDVTDSYYDYKTKLKTLEAEYDKVIEFYDRAETINELMSIEERLSNIQYQIDGLKLKINNYDLLTKYSTLEVSISETEILTNTSETFLSKVNNAFIEGWENLKLNVQDAIVFGVYHIWELLIALFGLIVAAISINVNNRKSKKKTKEQKKDKKENIENKQG